MALSDRYALASCDHCGEAFLRSQLAPCPFQPTKPVCAACRASAQQCYEVPRFGLRVRKGAAKRVRV